MTDHNFDILTHFLQHSQLLSHSMRIGKFEMELTSCHMGDSFEKRPVHSPRPQGLRMCSSPPDGTFGTSYTPRMEYAWSYMCVRMCFSGACVMCTTI